MKANNIESKEYYRIGEAARLVGCCRQTLLHDAQEGLIKFTLTARGMKKFLGADLIHYRKFVI